MNRQAIFRLFDHSLFSERERNRLRAQKALASGKTREAEQFFQKAIEITPEMVLKVIRVLNSCQTEKKSFRFLFQDSSSDGHRCYRCTVRS